MKWINDNKSYPEYVVLFLTFIRLDADPIVQYPHESWIRQLYATPLARQQTFY